MSAGPVILSRSTLLEPPLLHHAVEDVGDAAGEVGLLLVAEGRVVERRGVDDRGQGRALRDAQLADVLVEVRLGGGLDAVGPAAVVDGVEVVLEDLILALLLVDLDGDDDLLELPGQRAVRGEEVVLHVLLGDRRAAALHVRPAQRLPHRPRDPGRGEARVGVEAAVLRREDSLLHGVRHLGERHRLAVALGVGEAGHLGLAVVVVDDRGLGVGEVVGRGDLDRRVGDGHGDRAEGDQAEQGEQHPLEDAAGAGPGLGVGRRSAAVEGLSTHDGPVCGVRRPLSQSCAWCAMYRGDITVLRFPTGQSPSMSVASFARSMSRSESRSRRCRHGASR